MTSQGAEELISVLEEQETRLVLESFTHDDAWRLGVLLVETARERGAPVAIDIRSASQQLFHYALPGSSANNDAWIDRKRRVVERYGASSFLVAARYRARGTTFDESSRLDLDRYAAHGGSFPLRVRAVGAGTVGTVSVSGLAQEDDHALIVEVLERFVASQRG
jgi:uncharacterized protein (UPF0303 family)